MQFIKTLFWVLLAILLVAFSYNNWNDVTVKIWSDTLLDTKLPMLIIGSFLLGFVPMWMVYRGARWTSKRRITSLENRLETPPVSAPPATEAKSPLEAEASS